MTRKANRMARVMGCVVSKADGREANGEDNTRAQTDTYDACLNALRN